MRIFCDKAIQYTSTGTVYIDYDVTPTCAVYDMNGVLIQAGLTSAVSADDSNAYVTDTTDVLYAHETLYRPRWTVTLNGTTYTVDGSPYEHYVPTTTDVTPPGPPTLGIPSAGETIVTVEVVPPADADYSVTTIYLIPVLGGDILTGTGVSGLVIVSGATPGVLYAVIGLAQDAAGNFSTPSNVGLATTLPATDIALPAWLKWWVNDEVEIHEHGPEAFDPSVTGDRRFFDLGRGRTWSFMLECHEPVFFGIRGIGGRMAMPRGMPAGLRDDKGT